MSEGLFSTVVYRSKEKVAWGMRRVLTGTKCNSGSGEVHRGQVRVIRVIKAFLWRQWKGPSETCCRDQQDREEVTGDGKRVTGNREGIYGTKSGVVLEDREVLKGIQRD